MHVCWPVTVFFSVFHATQEFIAKADAAADLDQLITAHEAYLATLLRKVRQPRTHSPMFCGPCALCPVSLAQLGILSEALRSLHLLFLLSVLATGADVWLPQPAFNSCAANALVDWRSCGLVAVSVMHSLC